MTKQKEDPQQSNAIKKSISITEAQDRWLRDNNISLSKLVQRAIDNYMNSEVVNDLMHYNKIASNLMNELRSHGYLIEIRKIKEKPTGVSNE
jgi:hypothetical protein